MALTTTRMEPRAVNFLFMAGRIELSVIFVWFLSLSGYSASVRKAAFCYVLAIPVLGVISIVPIDWLGTRRF